MHCLKHDSSELFDVKLLLRVEGMNEWVKEADKKLL
jgi:hypothetical protein